MPGLNLISPAALMRKIGTPEAPMILDVCVPEDFALDPRLIPSGRQISHTAIDSISTERQVVICCQKGKKLSQGAAALLRSRGIDAQALEGGVMAWAEAGLPMVPAAKLRGPIWVTRHRPKIDRIACPWLIRRFVDPEARVLFVAPSEVLAVAERFDATAFDAPDAPFQHEGGACTFDALLAYFELDTEPLQTLAKLVRAADLGRPDQVPEAAGLLAISVGVSRMHKDDQSQLEAGMHLYDALYRWARDGRDEVHSSFSGA